MNKQDLAARLARQLHRSQAKAADDVETLVYDILRKPKRSKQKIAAQKNASARGAASDAKP